MRRFVLVILCLLFLVIVLTFVVDGSGTGGHFDRAVVRDIDPRETVADLHQLDYGYVVVAIDDRYAMTRAGRDF